MDEASLCDKIALIQQGRFAAGATPGRSSIQFQKNPVGAVQATTCMLLIARLRSHPQVNQPQPLARVPPYKIRRRWTMRNNTA